MERTISRPGPPLLGSAGWEQGNGTGAGTSPCITLSIPARRGRRRGMVGLCCGRLGAHRLPSLLWGSAGLGAGLPGLIYNSN